MLDVVVLAGSANSGPLRECSSESSEAMIRIGLKPMVRYVVEALLESKNINKIVVVGSVGLRNIFPEESVEIVEAEGTAIENLIRGLDFVNTSRPVLISTCDIPLLTVRAVDDFLMLSQDKEIDLFYPIVEMAQINRFFPEIRRTSVNLREGIFTGGNLFLVNPSVIKRCAKKAEEFVYYRKSPFQLCRILGLNFVFKFLINRLSIPEVEEKVSDLLEIRARAVISSFPEIGIDVDKPSDYTIVSAYFDKPA